MSLVFAPTAWRKPISLVRSVTNTSMMFIMPIPPTISDTDAMAANRIAMTRARGLLCLEHFLHVADGKVVVLIGLDVVTLAQQRCHLVLRVVGHSLPAWTIMAPTEPALAWLDPMTFFFAVLMGIRTMSSWSWPVGDWPLGTSVPSTVKGTDLM